MISRLMIVFLSLLTLISSGSKVSAMNDNLEVFKESLLQAFYTTDDQFEKIKGLFYTNGCGPEDMSSLEEEVNSLITLISLGQDLEGEPEIIFQPLSNEEIEDASSPSNKKFSVGDYDYEYTLSTVGTAKIKRGKGDNKETMSLPYGLAPDGKYYVPFIKRTQISKP